MMRGEYSLIYCNYLGYGVMGNTHLIMPDIAAYSISSLYTRLNSYIVS